MLSRDGILCDFSLENVFFSYFRENSQDRDRSQRCYAQQAYFPRDAGSGVVGGFCRALPVGETKAGVVLTWFYDIFSGMGATGFYNIVGVPC